MITTITQGGLGNQMFQYAFGLAQATRLRTGLKIDRSRNGDNSYRPFKLNLFPIEATVVEPGMVGGSVIVERSLEFDQMMEYKVRDGDTLAGYWQCEAYFARVAPKLFYQFRHGVSPKNDEFNRLSNKIFQATWRSVALSVRRGDYVSVPRTQAYHGNLGLSYYLEALSIIREKVGDPVIFVFSDDIVWTRNNWKFGFETHFVELPPNQEDLDLKLMSYCNSAIVANSSFSWWGTWLGDHGFRTGPVVAPRQWFADPNAQEQARTICPARWIKI